MIKARNKLIATVDHIKTLKIVVGMLSAVVVAQWLRVGHLQEIRRVYIPPNLSSGIVTKFEEVPPPVVYTFGYYIFQQLNRWKSDGEKDYPNQIYTLQGFLTPSCISAFQDDMNEKRRLGELRRRVRMVTEISGQAYTRQRVYVETPDSWIMWLDLNVKETIANLNVKNINLRYKIRIVKFDVDKEVNPWGLALSCDGVMRPKLLNDDDIKKPFKLQGGAV